MRSDLGCMCIGCLLGVPLPPLYMRGAGLQERFPNWLRVGVLIGYNYISSCTRKIGSYLYTAGSFLQSCATNSPDGVRQYSVGPTHPVRTSALWTSSWVPWGNIPHSTTHQCWMPRQGTDQGAGRTGSRTELGCSQCR